MLETLITIILIGLIAGLVYVLIGIGLNVIFGVMEIINFAHGDFLMLGSFGVYWLYELFGLNVVVSAFLLAPLFFFIGIITYNLVIPRLLKSDDPHTYSFVVFFGIASMMTGSALATWGPEFRLVPSPVPFTSFVIGGIRLPASWVISAIVATVATVLLILLLYRSSLGRNIRAVIEDRVEAQLSGINVKAVSSISFGIGVMCAGIAGGFAHFFAGAVYPGMAFPFTVIAFNVVVLGGIGNPLGTVAGGLVFGVIESIFLFYVPKLGGVTAFMAMIVVLLLRPQGIIPRKE